MIFLVPVVVVGRGPTRPSAAAPAAVRRTRRRAAPHPHRPGRRRRRGDRRRVSSRCRSATPATRRRRRREYAPQLPIGIGSSSPTRPASVVPAGRLRRCRDAADAAPAHGRGAYRRGAARHVRGAARRQGAAPGPAATGRTFGTSAGRRRRARRRCSRIAAERTSVRPTRRGRGRRGRIFGATAPWSFTDAVVQATGSSTTERPGSDRARRACRRIRRRRPATCADRRRASCRPPLAHRLGLHVAPDRAGAVRRPAARRPRPGERPRARRSTGLDPSAYLYVERGYQVPGTRRSCSGSCSGWRLVLMLGGTLTATFLALSDARPDLATLSAVGASPRTRRGVAAAYAVAVGLVGCRARAPPSGSSRGSRSATR